MPPRKAAVILFDLMDKGSLSLLDKIPVNAKFVGVRGRDAPYRFTNEDDTKDADYNLQEALDSWNGSSLDLLFIPGGFGALALVENPSFIECLTLLVDAAERVVAFSLGANLLASTGRLDGKRATTHRAWASEDWLKQWPNVHWESQADVVTDGKFTTAYTVNERPVAQAATVILSSFGETFSDLPLGSNTPDDIASLLLDEPPEWRRLLLNVKAVAQRQVDRQRSEGVDVSADLLESNPFIREPATPNAIIASEQRLDTSLPEDYKQFLLTSDGTGFSGDTSIPGMARASELSWVDAAEIGLDDLRLNMDAIVDLTQEEKSNIPAFTQILQISDPDYDEIVCLVSPEFIKEAYQIVLSGRGHLSLGNLPPQEWLLFSFTPWTTQYSEFNGVLQYFESKTR